MHPWNREFIVYLNYSFMLHRPAHTIPQASGGRLQHWPVFKCWETNSTSQAERRFCAWKGRMRGRCRRHIRIVFFSAWTVVLINLCSTLRENSHTLAESCETSLFNLFPRLSKCFDVLLMRNKLLNSRVILHLIFFQSNFHLLSSYLKYSGYLTVPFCSSEGLACSL